MRNFILAAATVVAISFATSSAMADHYRHRQAYHHHGVHVPHHVVPHHGYRYAPVYPSRQHVYVAPHYGYGYHHNYHYARPGYASGGIAIAGPRISLYIGF